MRVLACLSMGALVSCAGPSWEALDTAYTFENFQADFDKTYNSTEWNYRKQLFEKSLTRALTHNADPTQSWKQAINQFSDRTAEEFSNSHGWRPSWDVGFTVKHALPLPPDFDLKALPVSVDWRKKNVITKVKNQGMCGSCWAFSSTENIESYVALNSTTLGELSPQNLVSCDANPKHCGGSGGCGGSIPELAFQYVMSNGLASETDYPYVSGGTSNDEVCRPNVKKTASITGMMKLKENNYEAVMNALATVGPLAINIDAIPMQAYGGGLFTGCAIDDTHIDHVVQLVGYGHDNDFNQDYWLIRNSWGTTWGEEGYMKLLRHNPLESWCAFDIYPSDGTGCAGGPSEVTVCGSCGILYDVSYPTGAHLL